MNRSTTGLMLASALVATGVAAVPASAVTPWRVIDEVYSTADAPVLDEYLTQVCGFDVMASTKGHFRVTVFWDRDGEFRVQHANPSMVTTYSSVHASLETADRGLDKAWFDEDGLLQVFGTGIHLKVKGEAYAIGLWRLAFEPNEDFTELTLVDSQYHGNFDYDAETIDAYLCTALGPQDG